MNEIYLDLSKLSKNEIKTIPSILDANHNIYHTDRILFKKGLFHKKFKFLSLNSGYTQWMSTEINIHNKKEINFSEFINLING